MLFLVLSIEREAKIFFFILHVLLKYPFSLRLLLIDIQSVVIPGGICLNFFKVAIPCSFNYPAVFFFLFVHVVCFVLFTACQPRMRLLWEDFKPCLCHVDRGIQ